MAIGPAGADWSMRRDGQTDRHNEVDSRFSQFCKLAYKNLRT